MGCFKIHQTLLDADGAGVDSDAGLLIDAVATTSNCGFQAFPDFLPEGKEVVVSG
jgi:hypothetical protein